MRSIAVIFFGGLFILELSAQTDHQRADVKMASGKVVHTQVNIIDACYAMSLADALENRPVGKYPCVKSSDIERIDLKPVEPGVQKRLDYNHTALLCNSKLCLWRPGDITLKGGQKITNVWIDVLRLSFSDDHNQSYNATDYRYVSFTYY